MLQAWCVCQASMDITASYARSLPMQLYVLHALADLCKAAALLQTLSSFNKQHSALQALYDRQLMDCKGTHRPEVCSLLCYVCQCSSG